MKEISIGTISDVQAGKLVSFTRDGDIWRFVFEKDLVVESYGGWRILEHNYGARCILGSRDLEKEPYAEVFDVLGNSECMMITANEISALVQLQFLTAEQERLTLDLLANSGKKVNWKFITSGGEVSDLNAQKNL